MVIYFLCTVLQCINLALLFSLLFWCHVSGAKICQGYQDIKWVLVAIQPLRPMSLGHWKAAFWLRSSGLATIISWILFEAPWQSWWMYSLGVSYWCCSEDLETTTGMSGTYMYLLMLLMQRWQMLRGNWTCSFPMVSLCQRLWASLNLTILIYLNHFDHTCP